MVLKIKNLKDEIVTIGKDIEPKFDKNVMIEQTLTTVCWKTPSFQWKKQWLNNITYH